MIKAFCLPGYDDRSVFAVDSIDDESASDSDGDDDSALEICQSTEDIHSLLPTYQIGCFAHTHFR